jgi:hypothetical protein
LLLELAQSKTRDGSRNKNRMKKMRCRPHSQQPTKGTSLNWITNGGRLLAWIGDQVRLKALLPNKRALYTVGGTASYYTGNNGKPIRGELKHKGAIRSKGTIAS